MPEQAIVPVKESSDSDVEAHPAVLGRQRKEWKLIATVELRESEDLRRRAQRWLRARTRGAAASQSRFGGSTSETRRY